MILLKSLNGIYFIMWDIMWANLLNKWIVHINIYIFKI